MPASTSYGYQGFSFAQGLSMHGLVLSIVTRMQALPEAYELRPIAMLRYKRCPSLILELLTAFT